MAGKTVKYTIDIELARSQEKITRLEASVKKLNDAVHVGDNRTKRQRKNKEDLIKTQDRLTKATQKHITIQAQASGAHANSTAAINKQIQALQAENRMLDVNSAKYKQNSASISQHANKMNQATGATGGATSATMELSRVVSDAPYGIRGVANNLSQFTSQMYYASAAAGGLGKALKQIGKLMMGPLGVVFAITAVISVLDYMSAQTDKTKKSLNSLNEAVASAGSNLVILKRALEEGTLTQEEQNRALEAANGEYDDLNLAVDENNQLTDASVIALDAKVASLRRVAKALALQSLIEEQFAKQLPLEAKSQELKTKATRAEARAMLELENKYTDVGNAKALEAAKSARGDSNVNEEEIAKIDKEIDRLMKMVSIEDLMDEQFDPKKKKGGKAPKDNNLGKSMTGGELDMSKTNQKNQEKELLSVIRHAEAKQLLKDDFAKKSLKAVQTRFDNQQTLRRDNFIIAQQLRKTNNADDAFIQADADRLIEEANDTHEATMLQSRSEHQAALGILEDTQDTATFNRQMKRESEAVDHELRMQALAIEGAKYVKQGRFTVEADQYEENKVQKEQEQDILKARYEALAIDSDERLKLEEKYANGAVEIKQDAAEREMEIEQAKADFRDQMLGHIGSGLGAASKLFKKNSAEAKVFALAEIAVGTAKGLINGLDIAQKTAKTTPAAAYTMPIFYASQVAAVLGAAASAKSVLQGGSSGGSRASSAASVPSFTPEFNVVGNSNENQLAEGISGQVNTPTRAYVVYEDIAEAGAVSDSSIETSGI
tara:strand:- start:530 stop:2860 length:2331 start_codon:yes stop_codon:yes gene_type:complete